MTSLGAAGSLDWVLAYCPPQSDALTRPVACDQVAFNQRGRNATQLNMAGTGIGTFNDRLRDAVMGGSPFAPSRCWPVLLAGGLWRDSLTGCAARRASVSDATDSLPPCLRRSRSK